MGGIFLAGSPRLLMWRAADVITPRCAAVQGLVDTKKPEEMISGPMTGALCVYSGLFMRFAWQVGPCTPQHSAAVLP